MRVAGVGLPRISGASSVRLSAAVRASARLHGEMEMESVTEVNAWAASGCKPAEVRTAAAATPVAHVVVPRRPPSRCRVIVGRILAPLGWILAPLGYAYAGIAGCWARRLSGYHPAYIRRHEAATVAALTILILTLFAYLVAVTN